MSKLRVLFVTHVVSLGGASQSLRELLKAADGIEADLAVPRWSRGAPDDAAIRAFFAGRVGKIHRAWLPIDSVWPGAPPPWRSARTHLVFPWLWRATRDRFYRLVEAERYDAVHLNSLVLHELATPELPFTLHVREILSAHHDRVRKSAARARGVVFIDEATRAPFAEVPLRHSVVLNNPIDMTGVGTLPADVERRIGGDPRALVVLAMIGDLADEKGTRFVVETFRRVRAPELRLVLVGRTAPGYGGALERAIAGDPRVIVWGVEPEIAKVYTLADYVLRGEAYPCVGRTVYEALYAGCGVMVPGDPAAHDLFEYERFAERIQIYRPRDAGALQACFESVVDRKQREKVGRSNAAAYAASFERFLRDAMG